MKNNNYLKGKQCVDCNKVICNVSLRCKSCSNNFRNGKYDKIKTGKATKLQGFAYLKVNDTIKFNIMKKQSKILIKRMWENMRSSGRNHPMTGKTHSDEWKKMMSKRMSGENHPLWKGGKSFEPYSSDFNIIFKEKIRERDNYTCQLCNLFEYDSLKLYNRKLHIHHVDYDKKNTLSQNCISLCLRCNILVNKDREIWTKHFQELLTKLYDYQYTQDQKIVLDFMEKYEDGKICQ